MRQPWERASEDLTISFSRLERYSRWKEPDSRAHAACHSQRLVLSVDLTNLPHCEQVHTVQPGRAFDTQKARAVLERH